MLAESCQMEDMSLYWQERGSSSNILVGHRLGFIAQICVVENNALTYFIRQNELHLDVSVINQDPTDSPLNCRVSPGKTLTGAHVDTKGGLFS